MIAKRKFQLEESMFSEEGLSSVVKKKILPWWLLGYLESRVVDLCWTYLALELLCFETLAF